MDKRFPDNPVPGDVVERLDDNGISHQYLFDGEKWRNLDSCPGCIAGHEPVPPLSE